VDAKYPKMDFMPMKDVVELRWILAMPGPNTLMPL